MFVSRIVDCRRWSHTWPDNQFSEIPFQINCVDKGLVIVLSEHSHENNHLIITSWSVFIKKKPTARVLVFLFFRKMFFFLQLFKIRSLFLVKSRVQVFHSINLRWNCFHVYCSCMRACMWWWWDWFVRLLACSFIYGDEFRNARLNFDLVSVHFSLSLPLFLYFTHRLQQEKRNNFFVFSLKCVCARVCMLYKPIVVA